MRLPAGRQGGARPAAAPRPAPVLGPVGLRVLLVDDNPDITATLGVLLHTCGHQVVVAHDGPQALSLLGQFKPYVALLDIGLPVMDGYELVRRLRTQPEFAGLRLFAVSGYGQDVNRARAEADSFERHFVKPIALEVLAQALARTGPPASDRV